MTLQKSSLQTFSILAIALLPSLGFAQENSYEKKLVALELELQAIKAQLNKQPEQANVVSVAKNWTFKSYGSMVYKDAPVFRNIQATEADNRATTDLERLVLEFEYEFSDQWQVEMEVEYEHGGTGSTLEYDGFEEFGEFETEIEAGGEVIVEKLEAKYTYNENLAIKFGHIYVPVGLGTDLHKPSQYFTTERHWSESSLIPQVWHETGVNIVTNWNDFTGQFLITTGLNSEYFRTYNWVATGHQRRFEEVNADDLAVTLRLDYGNLIDGSGFGISYYNSDTTGNRNNTNKVEGDGNLSILGLHGTWRYEDFVIKGQYLYGELEDSQEIALANKTTAGLQPGNFSQVGSEAESGFVEAAYNLQSLLNISTPLYLFTAYEFANPISEVEDGEPTARFDNSEASIGLNYLPIQNFVIKAQFSEQQYEQSNIDSTTSFSMSIGYYFSI